MPLILVPTPIGNLEDITLRALRVLREADVIACEDTRTTSVLLRHYGIRKPTVSYHAHNERNRSAQLMERLREGQTIALVSDAGTPGLSDPGLTVLLDAIEEGLPADVLPGPTALIPALLLSGLPPHPFFFFGFPPEKQGERRTLLEQLKSLPYTLAFYISPHKAARQISDLIDILGDRDAALVRELSKIHQETLKSPLSALSGRLDAGIKGELCLIVRGAPEDTAFDWQSKALALAAQGRPAREIIEELSPYAAKNQIKSLLFKQRAPEEPES
jgi:16S rRNA (cytidine1402-2'-O)-methyltransferase